MMELLQQRDDAPLHFVAAMITADGYLHGSARFLFACDCGVILLPRLESNTPTRRVSEGAPR